MSAPTRDLVCELLAQSLAAWGVRGDVHRTYDGAIAVFAKQAGEDGAERHRPPPLTPPLQMLRARGEGKAAATPRSVAQPEALAERDAFPSPREAAGRGQGWGAVAQDASLQNEHDVRANLEIRIERAPPDLPFRWMVSIGERKRGAVSLVAVLRQVRTALDPGYASARVRVALAPLVPS